MDNRKNNGGHSTKPISPNDKRLATKTDIQNIYDDLKPFSQEALEQHGKAIKNGEKWAVELFFKYFYGMPKQSIQHSGFIAPSEQPITPERAQEILDELKSK